MSYGLYEIEWKTESGGHIRIVTEETILHDENDCPINVAYMDYYCLGDISFCRLRDATQKEYDDKS